MMDKFHSFLFQNQQGKKIEIHFSHIDSNTLLLIRIACFIYLTLIYMWSLVDMGSFLTNIIYLTMQGYLITWLYFSLVLQDYFFHNHLNKKFVVSQKLKYYIQIIYETAICYQVVITLIFWGFLFKILLQSQISTSEIIMQSNLHAGPIICLTLDLIYNNFSFHIRHLCVPIAFGTIYMIINLIYSLQVHVIYRPIDWVSLLSYILVLFSVGLVILSHYIGRIIHRKIKLPKLEGRITTGLVSQGYQTMNDNTKTNQNL